MASLLARMYRNSLEGKPGDNGTAMLLLPRIDNSVTAPGQLVLPSRVTVCAPT